MKNKRPSTKPPRHRPTTAPPLQVIPPKKNQKHRHRCYTTPEYYKTIVYRAVITIIIISIIIVLPMTPRRRVFFKKHFYDCSKRPRKNKNRFAQAEFTVTLYTRLVYFNNMTITMVIQYNIRPDRVMEDVWGGSHFSRTSFSYKKKKTERIETTVRLIVKNRYRRTFSSAEPLFCRTAPQYIFIPPVCSSGNMRRG